MTDSARLKATSGQNGRQGRLGIERPRKPYQAPGLVVRNLTDTGNNKMHGADGVKSSIS
jgi:hypothetical protein